MRAPSGTSNWPGRGWRRCLPVGVVVLDAGTGGVVSLNREVERTVEGPPGHRRDDLDGAVALGERLPEAAVRVGPRAERRQGVMAGIEVDEQRVVGVERGRQLDRK